MALTKVPKDMLSGGITEAGLAPALDLSATEVYTVARFWKVA